MNALPYTLYNDDCLTRLGQMEAESVDCIITDPPYMLGFMGKSWDSTGISFQSEVWEKCLRVLKPGGYLLAFGGSRTFHRIACAIEDAGFEIRDTIMWLYGSGFPKSMNVGLAIDKKKGIEIKSHYVPNLKNNVYGKGMGGGHAAAEAQPAQNEWNGWGSCLKPSFEPIILARKPFKGSLVDNVLEHGVGGLNIDECRVGAEAISTHNAPKGTFAGGEPDRGSDTSTYREHCGRFPANTILTYSEEDKEEVCGGFPSTKGVKSARGGARNDGTTIYNKIRQNINMNYECGYNDEGSAARYFYCAKASKKDRDEGLEEFEAVVDCDRNPELASADVPMNRTGKARRNTHPTVKPTALMQYLIRLVAPRGAIILDPFMGSGSTGKAVMYENKEREAGYTFIGIEKEADYCELAKARIEFARMEE